MNKIFFTVTALFFSLFISADVNAYFTSKDYYQMYGTHVLTDATRLQYDDHLNYYSYDNAYEIKTIYQKPATTYVVYSDDYYYDATPLYMYKNCSWGSSCSGKVYYTSTRPAQKIVTRRAKVLPRERFADFQCTTRTKNISNRFVGGCGCGR